MTTYSSILAWRIPWTEEPDGLQFIASQCQTQVKRLGMHAPMILYKLLKSLIFILFLVLRFSFFKVVLGS